MAAQEKDARKENMNNMRKNRAYQELKREMDQKRRAREKVNSSQHKKNLNDVSAAPFWCFFCCWQLRKRHQKWGSCDVIKILLIS